MRCLRLLATLATFFLVALPLVQGQQPQDVSVCELQENRAAYNHKLISVEGFVSHDFEDFSLFDPSCRGLSIWLEYGATAASNTMYCCGITPSKTRPKPLVVEGISIPLVDDPVFRRFDREIQPPFRSGRFGSVVHAKLVGRFFAGSEGPMKGYGHMGCCSLLAIQEVVSVDAQDRDDLDYGASPDQPNLKNCDGYQELTPIFIGSNAIEAQREADSVPSSKAMNDPEAVAREYLTSSERSVVPKALKLKVNRKANGRIVYDVLDGSSGTKFMIVISRPYLLSFYAQNPKRVAWVPIAAYKLSCE